MNHDRIHQALDGELPLDQLEPSEAMLYHQSRQALSSALRPLARVPEVDLAPAILRTIHGHRASAAQPRPRRRLAALAASFWAPRTVTVRPALGLAAAALAVVVLVAQIAAPSRHVPRAIPLMVVEFRLAAPDAGTVSLVGDFNAWRPEHELREVSPGVWSVSVALEPGVYNYGFMVDGATIRLDPLAPRAADGFGGENSRITVLPPTVRS